MKLLKDLLYRTRIEQVDLRYRNGFAARIPAFRERTGKPRA